MIKSEYNNPNNYSDIDSYLFSVSTANLLSSCGGPYPDSMDCVIASTSADKAVEIILSSQLDPISKQGLDKLLTAVSIATRSQFPVSFLSRLVGYNPAYDRIESEFSRKIDNYVIGSSSILLNSNDIDIVHEHIASIFTTTALLIQTNEVENFPHLVLISDLALAGYLPVDISIGVGKDDLVVTLF